MRGLTKIDSNRKILEPGLGGELSGSTLAMTSLKETQVVTSSFLMGLEVMHLLFEPKRSFVNGPPCASQIFHNKHHVQA